MHSEEYTFTESTHFLSSLRLQNCPETTRTLLPISDSSPAVGTAGQHRSVDPGPVRQLRDPAHPRPRRGRQQVQDRGQAGGASVDAVPAQVCQQRGGEVCQ